MATEDKYIFLDIDEVLNSELFFMEKVKNNITIDEKTKDEFRIDETRVDLLNEMIKSTGAKVVISSTWRKTRTPELIQEILNKKGFIGEIVGATKYLTYGNSTEAVPRGCEIEVWLKENVGKLAHLTRYVILDDDGDMLRCQRNNFFLIDKYCGLTTNTVFKACNFLNGHSR